MCETGILGMWPSLPCLRAHFPSVHLPKYLEKYSTAGMLKKVRSCRLLFLHSCILSYCIYPTASIHSATLWTGSSKALCAAPQHVHPQFWVKLIPANSPAFQFHTNMKANTVFCLQTSQAPTKGVEEIKSSAEWLRSQIHQPSSSVMDSSLKSLGEEVQIKL